MFDCVGAEILPGTIDLPTKRQVLIASLVGALAGSVVWADHRVLGALAGAAVAENAYNFGNGGKTWQQAVHDLGCHVAATAASLALPSHPVIGYLAGAVTTNLIVNGNKTGVLDRMSSVGESDTRCTHLMRSA